MDKISFDITDLLNQKPKKVFLAYVTLHDDYIEYKTDYFSDSREDEDSPWENDVYNYFHEFADKDAVKGFYISYREKLDQWKVNINITGFAEDIYIMFNEREDAKQLLNKLVDWKYKKL